MSEEKNEIITDQQKLNALTNPEYSGNDSVGGSLFPPILNILQSDKQYKAFGVEEITGDTTPERKKEIANLIGELSVNKGKLFIRRQTGNTIEDLVDSVTGTLIKFEFGMEVLEGDGANAKIVDSSNLIIKKEDKDKWLATHPGKTYRNMVKIILSPDSNREIIESAISQGINPFFLLPIKGSAWPNWNKAKTEMNQLAMASNIYGHKQAHKLAVSVFKFTITSMKVEQGSLTYYVPDIKVALNDPNTAFDLSKYTLSMKDFSLFSQVPKAIEENNMDDEELSKTFNGDVVYKEQNGKDIDQVLG